MTSEQMEKALSFLISKLPEDQLAELDAAMEGGASADLAQDSQRKAWLALDSRARIAVRDARKNRIAQDSAGSTGYAERFPNANRLK